MPQVSKNKLKPNIRRNITNQFVETISSLDKHSGKVFFEKFFTKTERLMFAKRLAIVFLLSEGRSAYRISLLLKVSQSTIHRLDRRFSRNEKQNVIKACEEFHKQSLLFKEFKQLLLEGLSMDPKKRVKWLNEFERRYE